jgi:hypothetical protein
MTDIIELANAKQALFDHMAQEHNVTLLESEMQDIVTLCNHISSAQLLTQQEPVVELSEFAKAPIGKILPHGEIDLYDNIQTINEMVGFEIYIHPQDKLNFPPPPVTQQEPAIYVSKRTFDLAMTNASGIGIKGISREKLLPDDIALFTTPPDTQQLLEDEYAKGYADCGIDYLNIVKANTELQQKLDKAREVMIAFYNHVDGICPTGWRNNDVWDSFEQALKVTE